MKQEKASLTSSAGLFVSLLCLVGVVHVEYKLYSHEVLLLRENGCEKTLTKAVEAQQLLQKHDTELNVKHHNIQGKSIRNFLTTICMQAFFQ